ncbi:hypothetical protein ACS0TY_017307 [Phlomoides rotata]
MDKVKHPFKIYQNSVNGSFLLNTMKGNTTRFANDMFKQKRAMILENKLIGTENTQRKTCNMMHVERWHKCICQFCATQEKPLFGMNFPIKKDRPKRESRRKKRTNPTTERHERRLKCVALGICDVICIHRLKSSIGDAKGHRRYIISSIATNKVLYLTSKFVTKYGVSSLNI